MMMILVSGDNYLMLFVGWKVWGCARTADWLWYDKGKDNAGKDHPTGKITRR